MAADEANLDKLQPRIELQILDDESSPGKAASLARELVRGDAIAIVGPGTTPAALAGGPIYANGGLASIVPYAHGAAVSNATTFLTTFDSTEMGSLLAGYLRHALDRARAVVIYKDNGYGRPIAAGFKATAERVGLRAEYRAFDPVADAAEAARQAAADPDRPAIVLAMVDGDAAAVLKALARQGLNPTVLGTSAIAAETFVEEQFAKEPETRNRPGFFTSGVYALAPLIVDSANAEGTRFAERYRARFGHVPRWEAAQGCDATRLAIAAGRAALARGASDVAARRKAVVKYLTAIDGPAQAISSLTGPLWFTPTRNRQQAARVGRFHDTGFESAPIQLVPASHPTKTEIASGDAVEVAPGHFARRQQVVYAGVFVNEVSRIDLAPSTFTADLYLWLRYKPDRSAGAIDPAEIDFPDLVRGNFDPRKPAEAEDLDDGSAYRLWRVRGEFKNDFDLRRYPADRQTLKLSVVHARAAADRLVFVQDRRVPLGRALAATAGHSKFANAAPAAFRNLTQWEAEAMTITRDIRVTESALGNQRRVGAQAVREVNGIQVIIEVSRHILSTLVKTLLPLALLTLIMYASLHFPQGLVKEKAAVAITAALSGAVLLAAINAQLGSVGYVIAVEVVFYIFFALCLLCIVSVLAAERLRAAGKNQIAVRTEAWTRLTYLAVTLTTIVAAWLIVAQGMA